MPTWGQILGEVNSLLPTQQGNTFNIVRNKYVKALSNATGRDTIVYLSRWSSGDAPPMTVSINDEDIHAFMEAIAGLKNNQLDLILHTGGGSAETTDAIVSYLRQKFAHIRVIIPQAAMSAGTMLACAADEIIMGKQSSIGPIDPQFILQTAVGIQSIPATPS
jgi:ClpP class serine protease